MEKLEAIEQKLQKIRSIFDDVAGELVASDVPCRTADIDHIGEALAAISDVQLSIYEQRPDLKPEYLTKDRNEKSRIWAYSDPERTLFK